MKSSTGLALAAAACALAVWLAWPTDPRPRLVATAADGYAPPAEVLALADEPDARRTIVPETPVENRQPAHALPPAAPAAPPPRAVPPGTIEVLVRRAGRPEPSVRVWVAPSFNFPELAGCLDTNQPVPEYHVSALTDGEGLAIFAGLEEGASYLIGLEPSTGSAPAQRIAVTFASPGRRYVLELGAGVIRGRVRDADGRPATGAGVAVSLDAHGTEPAPFSSLITTGADGRYEVRDLPPGRYWVMMDRDGRFDGGGLAQQKDCRLEEAAEVVIDFGDPTGAPRWSGTLRNELGDALAGPGSLSLHADPSGDYVSSDIEGTGRFELRLAPGRWRVCARIPGAPESGFDLGRIELTGSDIEQDLVLRGARLAGSVRHGRTNTVWNGIARPLSVSIRPEGHGYPAAIRSVQVDGSGRYALDGLGAGTWIVSTWPVKIDAGESLEITIREAEQVVALDLVVRD